MGNGICSVDGCERIVYARAMCESHYRRWLKDNPGERVPRRPGAICAVEGCGRKVNARGWCSTHYNYWWQTGSPVKKCPTCDTAMNPRRKYCSDDCKPRCSEPTCRNPVYGTGGLCALHGKMLRQEGQVRPVNYRWAEVGEPCVVCGGEVPVGSGRRKHCSPSCQAADSRHKGNRPKVLPCRVCGQDKPVGRIDGRFQRTDRKVCSDCEGTPEARRYKLYNLTPSQYSEMVKRGCAICGATDRNFHVDHDHSCCPGTKNSCGKCVRGVLCGNCNQAIGLFSDRTDLLKSAIAYLGGDAVN